MKHLIRLCVQPSTASTNGLHGNNESAHHDVHPARHEATQPLWLGVQRSGGSTRHQDGAAGEVEGRVYCALLCPTVSHRESFVVGVNTAEDDDSFNKKENLHSLELKATKKTTVNHHLLFQLPVSKQLLFFFNY